MAATMIYGCQIHMIGRFPARKMGVPTVLIHATNDGIHHPAWLWGTSIFRAGNLHGLWQVSFLVTTEGEQKQVAQQRAQENIWWCPKI